MQRQTAVPGPISTRRQTQRNAMASPRIVRAGDPNSMGHKQCSADISLRPMRSVFNDEKKLSIAALSQTLPERLRVDLRSASKGAGFPSPISPEAGPVPAHKSLRPDDCDSLEDGWKPSIQHDQEQAIPIPELDAAGHPPLQHNQLMSECRVLCLKSAL